MNIPAHDHPHAVQHWVIPLQARLRHYIQLNKFQHEVLRLEVLSFKYEKLSMKWDHDYCYDLQFIYFLFHMNLVFPFDLMTPLLTCEKLFAEFLTEVR